MARFAGFAGMGAQQFITCEPVVECLFAETDDLEIAAMMIIMANHTLF
jgi:hypothetical protein